MIYHTQNGCVNITLDFTDKAWCELNHIHLRSNRIGSVAISNIKIFTGQSRYMGGWRTLKQLRSVAAKRNGKRFDGPEEKLRKTCRIVDVKKCI